MSKAIARMVELHHKGDFINAIGRRALKIKSKLDNLLGFRIVRSKFPQTRELFQSDRYWYQNRTVNFQIAPGERVLDIGSGPAPFRYATHLCDLHEGDTVHRRGELKRNGLPLTVADIHSLPFEDKSFDFVYSAHVLEHVDDPEKACREMIRVGKRGYIETPNFMKDMLFCQARGMHHKWHTVGVGKSLYFFEYSAREAEGIRSLEWQKMLYAHYEHPMQRVFMENQDLFNTMFSWSGDFEVKVVRQPR